MQIMTVINQKYNVLAHTFGFLFPSERHLVDLYEELLSSSLLSSSKQTSLQEKKQHTHTNN